MPEPSSSSSETNSSTYRLIRPRPQIAKQVTKPPKLLPKFDKPRILKPWPPPPVPIVSRQYSAFRPFNADTAVSLPRPIKPAVSKIRTIFRAPVHKRKLVQAAFSQYSSTEVSASDNHFNENTNTSPATESITSAAQAETSTTTQPSSSSPTKDQPAAASKRSIQYPPIRPAIAKATPPRISPLTVTALPQEQSSSTSDSSVSQVPAPFTGPFYLVPTPGSNGVYQLVPASAPNSAPPVALSKGTESTSNTLLVIPKRRTRRCQLCKRFGCRGSQRRHLCTAKTLVRQ
ncbi:unnamed protein product [Umbelopsis vinacea]